MWTRVNAMGLGPTHAEDVRSMLGHLAFLELERPVLVRALEPFPAPVRTLDALHLASIEFLRGLGQRPSLATYNRRQAEAARALAIPLLSL